MSAVPQQFFLSFYFVKKKIFITHRRGSALVCAIGFAKAVKFPLSYELHVAIYSVAVAQWRKRNRRIDKVLEQHTKNELARTSITRINHIGTKS